jgi:hypothetical protein
VTEQGVVSNVYTRTLGAYLTAGASIGATSLVVDSILDFPEGGGSLTLNSVTYPYAAANYDTNTLSGVNGVTGITGTAVVSDRVAVSPAVVQRYAEVIVEHTETSMTVRVPHALMDRVLDGVRFDAGERVVFDEQDNHWVMLDVLNKLPVIDGSLIDPTTLPPNPSDGIAPASSPTPVIIGGIRQFFLTWAPVSNSDPVTYDVHMSLTASFTAGPSTLVGSTEGTTFITQIENPDYTATYYHKIIARDADGSAAAGPEVAAVLVAINSPDLAANIVRANNILAGEIQGFHIAANFFESGVIQTASSGRRLRLSIDGFQMIDADESLVLDFSTVAGAISTFYGALQTLSLLSLDNFEMRGANNQQAVGSVYTLSAGIGQSGTPPVATVAYPATSSNLDATFYRTKGVDWGSTYSYYVRRFLNTTVLERRTISGQDGPSQDLYALGMFGWGVAICNDGTADRAMVLFEGKNAGGSPNGVWKVRKFNVTSWPTLSTVTDYTWTHDTAVIYFGAAIGRDYTDASRYITAEVLPGGTQIRFRRYSSVDGSLVSTTTTGDLTSIGLAALTDKTIRGVSRGTYDIGTDYYMVAMVDRVWFFDPGTGAFITSPGIGPSFFTNGTQNAFQWNPVASKFIGHSNDDTSATLYSGYGVTGNHSDTLWAAYTWYDSAGTTHETPMSAQKKFTMVKRGQVTLTAPALPGAGGADDPNAVRFYVGGPSATALARTAMWDQATEPGTGVLTLTYQTLRLATGGGAVNPPATNNFPAAAPAVWQSGAVAGDTFSYTRIYGDGTGRMLEVVTGYHAVSTSTAASTSTTPVNATGLLFPALANGVYEVEFDLIFTTNTSASSLRVGWSMPSGASYNAIGVGPAVGSTDPTTAVWIQRSVRSAVSGTLVFGCGAVGGADNPIRGKARIAISTTAGNCQLQFMQNAAGGTTTFQTGSWITARRVA